METNKIRQQAEERDEGSAKSAAMICETCKYQHTSEDVWPCKHCTPDDRRYEKAQAHYPEEWGPSDNRRLTCVCGDPDPFHATKTPNAELSGGAQESAKNAAGGPSARTQGSASFDNEERGAKC